MIRSFRSCKVNGSCYHSWLLVLFLQLLMLLLTELYTNIGTNARNWLPTAVFGVWVSLCVCGPLSQMIATRPFCKWTHAFNNVVAELCNSHWLWSIEIDLWLFIYLFFRSTRLNSTQKPLHIEIICSRPDDIPNGKFPSFDTAATKLNDSCRYASCVRSFWKSLSWILNRFYTRVQ